MHEPERSITIVLSVGSLSMGHDNSRSRPGVSQAKVRGACVPKYQSTFVPQNPESLFENAASDKVYCMH